MLLEFDFYRNQDVIVFRCFFLYSFFLSVFIYLFEFIDLQEQIRRENTQLSDKDLTYPEEVANNFYLDVKGFV